MKFKAFVFAITAAASMSAGAEDYFDYENTQRLYVVAGPEAILYGQFPVFVEFRDVITEKMRGATDVSHLPSTPTYTLRVVGIGKETTLYVGDSWIGSSTRIAPLSDVEFAWIADAVEHRKGKGIAIAELESHVRYDLDQQKDPAWTPDP